MTEATHGGTGGRAFENVCAVNADHNDSCFLKCDQFEWIPIVVIQLHFLVGLNVKLDFNLACASRLVAFTNQLINLP